MCAIHHEQTTYGPPSAREEQETVRIDVVAYNRKRRMMPSDRRSDKGLPTRSERVSPGPLSRKPSGFLFSSLGRDGHEAKFVEQYAIWSIDLLLAARKIGPESRGKGPIENV